MNSSRIVLAIVSAIAFTLLSGWLAAMPASRLPAPPAAPFLLVASGCAALYLASHVLRAARLAIIGLSVHGTSFRTVALLHLAVSPWSMIAPFKLDEIIRINELRSINGSLARAVLTVIIDRSVDGPVLILLAACLAFGDHPDVAFYTGAIGAALVAITIGFVAASHVLRIIQRHIFLYHYRPRALHALRIVDNLYALARVGRETITQTAAILILCTIGIWCCEIAAVGLFMQTSAAPADLPAIVAQTLIRANIGWRTILLHQPAAFPTAAVSRIFTIGLLLIWPPSIYLYWRRRDGKRHQPRFLNREWNIRTLRKRS